MSKYNSKGVSVVSIKLIKEGSFLYEKRKCTTSQAAYGLFSSFIEDKANEQLVVAALNVKEEPVNISTVHIGTILSSMAIPRDVVRTAILSNAPSIIVVHNHPSGDTTPSKADISFTQELYKACELLQIKLLDHLIIGFWWKLSFNEIKRLVWGSKQ
ncbi:JAB domain-containing protein [Liquorilactobacillus uvarum]|uniref:DNA repair protein RadC n=1 Tax=Liquorilactobacillus uvarum DSM 19971 TaxID=1423812 RepID=A0A0R1Q635_9LACO|nr:JAB domain-containing protein [Liquorilactobacillus uvarum]KRL38356.1 DNA repair protein RadC [Liquorilactobacillus uvarum DSM 19971]